MSEKEKTLVEKVARLPQEMQQRFLDQAEGALLMQETMKKTASEPEEAAEE